MKIKFVKKLKQTGVMVVVASMLQACGQKEMTHAMLLEKDWKIQSAEKAAKDGAALSVEGVDVKGWVTTEVPSTIFNSLVKAGVYKDVFFGKNLEKIPVDEFNKPWWYRTEFTVAKQEDATSYKLEFDGIVYRANIWLNGKQIGTIKDITGAFRRFSINVSDLIKAGEKNVLAVEVFPTQAGDFSVGFVDWNPDAPGKNMGIWREVRLRISGDVSLNHPFVKSKLDIKEFKSADLTVTCEVQNNKNTEVSGTLEAEIEGIKISQEVTLKPNENKVVEFSPEKFKELKIANPRVWWAHDMGKPEMYNTKMRFVQKNVVSDVAETDFGIRDIKDYTYTKHGQEHKGYILNGKKIVIKGGGWVDHLFLDNDPKKLEHQLEYVKHMNMNTVRLEGFWGNNKDIYDLCDKHGILIMVGWSCHWEWGNYCGKDEATQCGEPYGCIRTKEEQDLIAQSWEDQMKWVRNNPSIILWMFGSDMIPLPELEQRYREIFKKDDPTRPYVTSAKQWKSSISGWSGMKMAGPYEYVPPVYWYIDTVYGGAFGFNSETGPGAQVPPLESMKRMIPANELWPINDTWNYHCGRNEFNTLDRYNDAMYNRFGKASSIEEYCKKAQLLNYESIRPMFEAFQANRYDATGVIQWMLNSSWPKLIWQLYGYDLMPNGAFYGTKKALEPVHVLFNYGNNEIVLSNITYDNLNDLTVDVKLYNLDMTLKVNETLKVAIGADQHKVIFTLPENIQGLDKTSFLDLRLKDKAGKEIVINQYLVTQTKHEFDWKATFFVNTPTIKHQNLQEINALPQVSISQKASFKTEGEKTIVTVELQNPSKSLAFFIEVLVHNDKTNESVLPVFLEDNYISLLPGEKRTITGSFYTDDLNGAKPIVKVSGYNLK